MMLTIDDFDSELDTPMVELEYDSMHDALDSLRGMVEQRGMETGLDYRLVYHDGGPDYIEFVLAFPVRGGMKIDATATIDF